MIHKHKCIDHITISNVGEITCSKCGKFMGVIYSGGLYLLNAYKKYRSKIENSQAFESYTKYRKNLDSDRDAEWRDFLGNLGFSEDEIYSVETTEERIPEDCHRENAFGC